MTVISKQHPDIIGIMQSVVALMTPTVTITLVEASGVNWKLSTCNTYWLRQSSPITIDGVSYTVVDFEQNEYIIVSGTVEPVVTEFSLEAPEFWHGTHRKVSNERDMRQGYVSRPFVYLPIPVVNSISDDASSYAYSANVAPIFLMNYDVRKDTTTLQQELMIRPLLSMVKVFFAIIEEQPNLFSDVEGWEEIQIPNFGDEAAWGRDSLIFNQPLSGVQALFTFNGYEQNDCQCNAPIQLCAGVSFKINGVYQYTEPSGGTINYTTEVSSATIQINSEELTTVPAGDTLNISVQDLAGSEVGVISTPTLFIVPFRDQFHYLRPRSTGQTVSYNATGVVTTDDAIKDTAWKVRNGIDSYTAPQTAKFNSFRKDKNWLLNNVNRFGHYFLWTGIDGGYYDPETMTYHLVNGTETDQTGAFPNGVIFDNVTGLFWYERATTTTLNWVSLMADGYAISAPGIDHFYIPTVFEMLTIIDYSTTFPASNVLPPFNFTTSTKITSDTYLNNPGQAFSISVVGQVLTTPKNNTNRSMYLAYTDPNSII